jgi:hypothetical protein
MTNLWIGPGIVFHILWQKYFPDFPDTPDPIDIKYQRDYNHEVRRSIKSLKNQWFYFEQKAVAIKQIKKIKK